MIRHGTNLRNFVVALAHGYHLVPSQSSSVDHSPSVIDDDCPDQFRNAFRPAFFCTGSSSWLVPDDRIAYDISDWISVMVFRVVWPGTDPKSGDGRSDKEYGDAVLCDGA